MEAIKSYKFSTSVFNFGRSTPTGSTMFSFPIGDGLTGEDVQYIQAGCGCSDAYWDDESNSVIGTLDMAKAGSYSEKETPVTKTVTVYFNDGEDRYISDPKKRMITNNNKKRQVLTITGKVILE